MNQYESVPKYQKIVDYVEQNIKERAWKAGDKLPTEKALMDRFQVSRQTVRRALEVLNEDGVISSVQGSGSFIRSTAKLSQQMRVSRKNIAVITTYSDNYIFPATLKGVETVLSDAGYTMQVAFTHDSVSDEREILSRLIETDAVDGVIVEPAKSALPNPNLDLYRTLTGMGIPILFFNAYYSELNFPCVRIDDFDVAYRATEYLIQAGHKNIAGIFNPEDGQGHLRYAGYLKALWRNGLYQSSKNVIWRTRGITVDRLEEGVTAALCYNDEVAFKLILSAQENGVRVPEDLSVVGIDNSDLGTMCSVPFTSFSHPKKELGEKLGENILKMISDPDYDGNYLFRAELVERSSVASRK